MSSTSPDSPAPSDGFGRRSEISHQQACGDKPGPIRYNFKSCVQCGQIFKYGQSEYESSSDPTLTWKRLSTEITEHYYSCPKSLANTHPPTSAIRNTLFEPSFGKWSGKEKMSSITTSAPYPLLRPSRHQNYRKDEGCSRPHDMRRFASPESILESRRATTPDHVSDSSHRAAPHSLYHGATAPPPHSSVQAHGAYERSPIVPPDTSRPPLRPLNQRPLSLAFLVATDPEPVIPSSRSLDKLPPLYRLKRKLAEIEDAQVAKDINSSSKAVMHTGSRAAISTHARPMLVTETSELSRTSSPTIDYEDDGEPPEKRFKKNVMDWRVRRGVLEADELLSAVEAKQVFCKLCAKWIKLDARNDFYPGLWKKHRKTMHEVHDKPEDRKKWSRVKGEVSSNTERQPLATRRRTTENDARAHRHEFSSEQDSRNLVLNTRVIRSSSHITRSSSNSSN